MSKQLRWLLSVGALAVVALLVSAGPGWAAGACTG